MKKYEEYKQELLEGQLKVLKRNQDLISLGYTDMELDKEIISIENNIANIDEYTKANIGFYTYLAMQGIISAFKSNPTPYYTKSKFNSFIEENTAIPRHVLGFTVEDFACFERVRPDSDKAVETFLNKVNNWFGTTIPTFKDIAASEIELKNISDHDSVEYANAYCNLKELQRDAGLLLKYDNIPLLSLNEEYQEQKNKISKTL